MVDMRKAYRPLRPELDSFLFAGVGAERDGIPLTIISTLARLGLDPWNEAERLSSLPKCEAVEQLARLIAELPGARRPLAEAREIAGGLIERLPRYHEPKAERSTQPAQPWRWRHRFPPIPIPIPGQLRLWLVCVVLAAAVAITIMVTGRLPFVG
jgi:hypothetical protein